MGPGSTQDGERIPSLFLPNHDVGPRPGTPRPPDALLFPSVRARDGWDTTRVVFLALEAAASAAGYAALGTRRYTCSMKTRNRNYNVRESTAFISGRLQLCSR